MTSKEAILDAGRVEFAQITGTALSSWGMLPDQDHLDNGGYHCGCQDIIKIGKWSSAGSSSADYSVRQARDRVGGNVCMAIDGPPKWGKGGDAAWIRHNNLLQQALAAGDAELGALRAINFTPDGKVKRRYDTNNRAQGVISSTDTVLWHTHYEFWRNTAGTSLLRRTIARMGQIMRAAVAGVTSWSAFVARELGKSMEQMVVRFRDAPDPNRLWLSSGGMLRRDITGMCEVLADGTVVGPVSNGQIFQEGLLGNLSNGGKVFVSAGNPNVWGVDVSTFDDSGAVEWTEEQVSNFGDAVVNGIRDELETAAFEGAQRAERE